MYCIEIFCKQYSFMDLFALRASCYSQTGFKKYIFIHVIYQVKVTQ